MSKLPVSMPTSYTRNVCKRQKQIENISSKIDSIEDQHQSYTDKVELLQVEISMQQSLLSDATTPESAADFRREIKKRETAINDLIIARTGLEKQKTQHSKQIEAINSKLYDLRADAIDQIKQQVSPLSSSGQVSPDATALQIQLSFVLYRMSSSSSISFTEYLNRRVFKPHPDQFRKIRHQLDEMLTTEIK